MQFDLQILLHSTENLTWMEEPFIEEEINGVISELPTNKSPGPDGFNSDFTRKCWPIIAKDFYELISAFYDGNVCLQSINGYILL